jgi:hypothetical protein
MSRHPAVVNGRFTRGKYEGKQVNQVLEADPGYIHFAWCSGSEHFGITHAQWQRAKELMAQQGKMHAQSVHAPKAPDVNAEGYRAAVERLVTTTRLSRPEAEEALRRMVQAQVARLGPTLQVIEEGEGLGGSSAMGGLTSLVNCRSVGLPVQYCVGDRVEADGKTFECTGVFQDEATFEERDEQPSFLDDPAVRELLSPVASFLD